MKAAPKVPKVREWDRLQWGVLFYGNERGVLIGSAWDHTPRTYPPLEPTRALLFTTRTAARKWCQAKNAANKGRTDCCATWRFRPVRVRETVRIIAKRKAGRK